MITQTLVTSLQEVQSNEESDPNQCCLRLLYTNILANNSKIPLLKSLNQLQAKNYSTFGRIASGKLISKKMRTKLLAWMENLALETFEFSIKTLILAIRILDQYLSLTNQSPSMLQLIGCASLYLAAKTYEPTIVAGECYIVASAKCFSQQQFFEKEMQIYRTLGYNTNFSCPLRVYKSMTQKENYTIQNNCSSIDIDYLMVEITKNIQFFQFQKIKIVSMMLALSQIHKRIPSSNEILEQLKLINHL